MTADKDTRRIYVPLIFYPKIYVILILTLLFLLPCAMFYFIPIKMLYVLAMVIPYLLFLIPVAFLSLMIVIGGEKFEFSFDKTGIYDNTTVVSLGEIKWRQMISFEVSKVSNVDAIVIHLTENFIDQKIQQQRNIFRKWLMIITYIWMEYPVYISQGSLKWDVEFVVEIMRDYQNGIETQVIDRENI